MSYAPLSTLGFSKNVCNALHHLRDGYSIDKADRFAIKCNSASKHGMATSVSVLCMCYSPQMALLAFQNIFAITSRCRSNRGLQDGNSILDCNKVVKPHNGPSAILA